MCDITRQHVYIHVTSVSTNVYTRVHIFIILCMCGVIRQHIHMHTRDTTRQYVWHDSSTCIHTCHMISQHMYTHVYIFVSSYMCVAWFLKIYICIRGTRLVNMCDMTRQHVYIHVTSLVNKCIHTHTYLYHLTYVWRDSSTHTHAYMWHDSSICVTWLTYVYTFMWHDWSTTYVYTRISFYIPVTWLLNMYMHTCDTTRQYVLHDSPTGIHSCDMISQQMYTCIHIHMRGVTRQYLHAYMWHDSSICVPWLANMYTFMWHD